MSDILDFGELDTYYPGSKEKRGTVPVVSPDVQALTLADQAIELLGEPTVFTIKGKDAEFFYIGALAGALDRSANTLRRWEDNGVIPRSGFTKPSKDPRGKRRLYSRAQCEGIIRIAFDEGILRGRKPLADTKFTERVTALFKELKKQ